MSILRWLIDLLDEPYTPNEARTHYYVYVLPVISSGNDQENKDGYVNIGIAEEVERHIASIIKEDWIVAWRQTRKIACVTKNDSDLVVKLLKAELVNNKVTYLKGDWYYMPIGKQIDEHIDTMTRQNTCIFSTPIHENAVMTAFHPEKRK